MHNSKEENGYFPDTASAPSLSSRGRVRPPGFTIGALALINKHIEAEGGPEKIDLVLVVHGPALNLFESEKVDQELKDKLKAVIDRMQAIDEIKNAWSKGPGGRKPLDLP